MKFFCICKDIIILKVRKKIFCWVVISFVCINFYYVSESLVILFLIDYFLNMYCGDVDLVFNYC